MKLAVLGGSFNPIHIGHLHLADLVLAALEIDQVLFVPANISPFKQNQDRQDPNMLSATAADRLDMILASITADPRINVDDLELRRGGISYTIDSLKEIIEHYKCEEKPVLILGDDLACDFAKWKEAGEISRLADILIARRQRNGTASEMGKITFPYPHRTLDNEILDISSAEIRHRINSGMAWHYLVPRGARLLIQGRGLYQTGFKAASIIDNELIARVEDAVRSILSPKRFIHSRNTAILARDLALCNNLDEKAAYLAGIAHDMAKDQASDLDHGKAAAVLLQERFDIHNRDILEAVEFHTTGKQGMSDLSKVVFIADKFEHSRHNKKKKHGPAKLDGTAKLDGVENKAELNDLFYSVLKDNISWLRKNGIQAAEESLRLLEETKLNENKVNSRKYKQ